MAVTTIEIDGDNAFMDRVKPKAPGLGLRIVFHENLHYPARQTPLAQPPAGTHSGVYTNIWTKLPGQAFGTAFAGGELIQNEATYDLKAVPASGNTTALEAGQITVRGVVPIDTSLSPFAGNPKATPSIAITGGTGAYKNARGQVTYADGQPHKLEIEL
jgi:hypothetical protein